MKDIPMWYRPLRSIRRRFEYVYLKLRGFGSGRRFSVDLARLVGPAGVLLDIGCGEGGLREVLLPGSTYVGVDRYAGIQSGEYVNWNMRPNVVGDANHLPFRNEMFTTVAMMHVLEHVSEPRRVFAEVHRVLKPGGYLFVDVPFLYQLHHIPNDFFRYTPFSLRDLGKQAGMEVTQLRPSGGYFRFISYSLRQAPGMITAPGWYAQLVRILVCWPLATLGYCLGKLQYALDICDAGQELVCGYHAIFRKPMNE
jgi:SAM-dependent methyltransferase